VQAAIGHHWTDGRTNGRNVLVGLFALSVDTEWDWLNPNGRFECGQLGKNLAYEAEHKAGPKISLCHWGI